jgi:hypothetical protein
LKTLAIFLIIVFVPLLSQSIKPLFYSLPGRVYPVDYNLSAINESANLGDLLKNDNLHKGLVFYFFCEEQNISNKRPEDFYMLLKETLKNCTTDFRVHIKMHKTEGTVFINNQDLKLPITHLNALVFSNDSLLLQKVFGKGPLSKIDTTTSRTRQFNFEFYPIRLNASENSFLYLFRSKLNKTSAACNPNLDIEIAAILKNIYNTKSK